MATDPVCGMQIDESAAAGMSDYDRTIYYFCSLACKAEFDDDPGRFVPDGGRVPPL